MVKVKIIFDLANNILNTISHNDKGGSFKNKDNNFYWNLIDLQMENKEEK